VSDELIRAMERIAPELTPLDQFLDVNTLGMTPDQVDRYQAESEELRRLWGQPLAAILLLLLPPGELDQLHDELAAKGMSLPSMFALEPDGNPIQIAIYRRIEPLHSPLYDTVCVKWDYCGKRKYADWLFRLALLVLASLLTGGVVTDVPMSPAIIAGIRSGYFDKLCNCGPSKTNDG
jgi:hypothetical protein